MKLPILVSLCFLTLAPTLFAEQVLLEDNFDSPTGQTYTFPPPEGEKYQKFSPNFTAWANTEGQIAVTCADKIGENKSGGISCKIARATGRGGYLAFNCEGIVLPITQENQIEEAIKDLEIDFSINVPTGRSMSLFLQASLKMAPTDPAQNELFRAKAYPSRVTLPKIIGNDEYTKYTVKLADIPATERALLTELVTETYKNGASQVCLTVAWSIGSDWQDDQEFLIDSVKISLNR